MGKNSATEAFQFLSGGGEMGNLMRTKDWSASLVGTPGTWPQSLRTTLSIILNSKFPMFLFWGPGLVCFYNDAYRPSLGNEGKHPGILGSRGEDHWQEIWPVIKPLIDQVLAGGEATWSEDQLIPIYRNGKMEDVYWTFSYSPVNDESGKPAGVFVTCNETTDKVNNRNKLEESIGQLEFAIEAARLGTWDYSPATGKFTANNRLKDWFGLAHDSEIDLEHATNVIAEKDRDRVVNAIQKALDHSSGGSYDVEYSIIHPHTGKETIVQAKGRAWFNDEKAAYRFNGTLEDVSEQVIARRKLEESEKDLHDMVMQAPVGICVIDAETCISEIVNDSFIEVAGKKREEIIGRGYWETFAEAKPYYEDALKQVIHTGISFYANEVKLMLIRHGKEEDVYVTFVYAALKNAGGKVKKVAIWVLENTRQVIERQRIEEADKRFRNTVQQAPVGITILRGPEFIVEMANDAYLQLVDRKEAGFVGRPLFESLPEVEKAVHTLLNDVLNTGVPFNGIEYPIPVNRYGKFEISYFNFLYHPLKEDDGKITGIIVTVTDVSESVKAKHFITESEKQFREMVMDSPIPMTIFRGTGYIVEVANNIMFRNIWRKKPEDVLGKSILDVFPELKDQKYAELLHEVYISGKVHKEIESPVYVQGDDGMQHFYLDFEYAPLLEPAGNVSGILVTVNDVTEKVEARIKLEESEKKLNIVIDASELGTWELNIRTGAVVYSDRFLEIMGFKKGDILTHEQLVSRIHPEDLATRNDAFEKAYDNGILQYEVRLLWEDGSIHWMEGKGKVFYNEAGKPAKMIGTARDITDRQAREESMARLAAIVQSSGDAIISKDLNGIIATWNAGAEEIFGYTAAEMIGQPLTKLIPADRINEESDILKKLKNGEHVNHFETKRITKDKRMLDISLTISPIRNVQGNVIGASKIARNISHQKEAERLITASEQKFRVLADSMPQFIWTGDAEGNLNYFNEAVYEYSGLTPEQIAREGWLQIVHPDDREANIAAWMHSVNTGTDFIVEHRFGRSDGTYRWQLSRAIPQRDAAGNIQMWVGTSTDIQDIKEQDQQKDFFISMASHELKTPITSIKGYVQLLQTTYAKGEDNFLKKSLKVIDKQILTLTSLISDLLDVSKIKSGSLVLNKQDFEITEMIADVTGHIRHVSPDYNISFSGSTAIVFADRERISQVLINLLTNAVKYSPSSKEITIKHVIEDGHVLVSVHDGGIGINKTAQEKIFERFYRVEGKDESTYPGFGIGLFISSEIIQRHQGKIGVNSEPGKGSVFYFSIPLKS